MDKMRLPFHSQLALRSSWRRPGSRSNSVFSLDQLVGGLENRDYVFHLKAKNLRTKSKSLFRALGTEQSQSFFGMPPVQSVVDSLSPYLKLRLYKAQYQSGFTRFRLDIFETTTGKFIRSTPWLPSNSTYYNEYTIFMFY